MINGSYNSVGPNFCLCERRLRSERMPVALNDYVSSKTSWVHAICFCFIVPQATCSMRRNSDGLAHAIPLLGQTLCCARNVSFAQPCARELKQRCKGLQKLARGGHKLARCGGTNGAESNERCLRLHNFHSRSLFRNTYFIELGTLHCLHFWHCQSAPALLSHIPPPQLINRD